MFFHLGGWSRQTKPRTDEPVDGPKEKWKPCIEAVKATIQFLTQTTRMQGKARRETTEEGEAEEGEEAEEKRETGAAVEDRANK